MLNAFWIVLLGMMTVFAILGILLLVMLLLNKLLPNKERKGEK